MDMRAAFPAALMGVALTWPVQVRADVPPSPERPVHWDEHPAPWPDPPPEKDPAIAVIALLAGLAALAWQSTRLHGRTPRVS